MLGALKNAYARVTERIRSGFTAIFSSTKLDVSTREALKKTLLEADMGLATTNRVLAELDARAGQDAAEIQRALKTLLFDLLSRGRQSTNPDVILVVGINGSGKTTSAAKIANLYRQRGSVLLAAADTFRAAATDQLALWGNSMGVPVVTGAPNADPASVAYRACDEYLESEADYLIIDTAGRMQTKTNLMDELAKVHRVVMRKLGEEHRVAVFLCIDSMLGQNSLEQAELFSKAVPIDGIILTKTDGTARGGIICAIAEKLSIPVTYVSFGESIDDISLFDARTYVDSLFDA